MASPLLEVNKISQRFVLKGSWWQKRRYVEAVKEVSFAVAAGETLGIVGESGSGKSTLGKTILHLLSPTTGQLYFKGEEYTQAKGKTMRRLRQQMQMVFQDPMESLNARHNIGMIIEEPLLIHGYGDSRTRRQRVLTLLDKVGMSAASIDKYPHEFSGGQRQRIGIARAIALEPQLLICDEAVSALDVSVQAQIINLLLQLQQEMGLAMIFIAHDLAVVHHVSDRIAVMHQGEIVEYGDAGQIYGSPQHPYTQTLLAAIPVSHPRLRKRKDKRTRQQCAI